MRRTVLTLAVLVLGLVPVLAGCGSSSSSSSSTTESSGGGGQKTIAGVKANDHGTKAVEDSGKTEVELDDFYFEPTVLEGRAGEKVTLELKNEGQDEHSFTIDAQSVDKDLEPGDEGEVTVTIPQSGVISFYCKYHKSSGMAGALAVQGGTGGMTGTGTTTEDNSGKGGGGGY
ncbi:MAG: cupredoxin domain-containing protein [Gaiellaceae bacterium]